MPPAKGLRGWGAIRARPAAAQIATRRDGWRTCRVAGYWAQPPAGAGAVGFGAQPWGRKIFNASVSYVIRVRSCLELSFTHRSTHGVPP